MALRPRLRRDRHHSSLGWWKPALREGGSGPPTTSGCGPSPLAAGAWRRPQPRRDQVGPPRRDRHATRHLRGCGWRSGASWWGFNEEMITRGLLIVGGRGTLHEGWRWFVSSLLLRPAARALRILRAELGGPRATQVFFAFVIGTSYYVTRRITGLSCSSRCCSTGPGTSRTFIQGHSVERHGPTSRCLSAPSPSTPSPVPLAFIAVWRLHHDEGDVVEPAATSSPPSRPPPDRGVEPIGHDLRDHAPTIPSALGDRSAPPPAAPAHRRRCRPGAPRGGAGRRQRRSGSRAGRAVRPDRRHQEAGEPLRRGRAVPSHDRRVRARAPWRGAQRDTTGAVIVDRPHLGRSVRPSRRHLTRSAG